MQNTHTKTLVPALEQNRWIYVKVNIKASYYEVLTKAISPFIKELKKENKISNFFYKKDGIDENFMMFFFKTSLYNSERYIKNQLKDRLEQELDFAIKSIAPVPSDSDFYEPTETEKIPTIEYLDYFIFDYIQLNHDLEISKILMPGCSELMVDVMSEEEEWGYEAGLEKGLALHLILAYSFDLTTQQLAHYFDNRFQAQFKLLELDNTDVNSDEWKGRFLKSLQDNFESQKDNLVAYCDYLLSGVIDNDEFEDEWVNNWIACGQKAGQKFKELKNTNQLSATLKPLVSKNIAISEEEKSDWAHIACYSDFIDNQLLLGPDFILILLFTLSKSLNELASYE